jgi:Flp pilus assembly protein TadD
VDSKDKNQQVKSLIYQGYVHLNDGEYRAAVFCYDKALELNEDNSRIWDNRGVALSKAGRYPDAVESFEIALDLEPDNAKAWINMGVSLGEIY